MKKKLLFIALQFSFLQYAWGVGSSGFSNQVVGSEAQNMANAFATGTAAQNDSLAARQGAYGGSAWSQKQSADAAGLERNIGQMANQDRKSPRLNSSHRL